MSDLMDGEERCGKMRPMGKLAPRKTVTMKRDLHERVLAFARSRGTTAAKVLEELTERGLVERPDGSPPQAVQTPPMKPHAHSLDQCAEGLLALLPKERYELAMEVCHQILGIRPWQLVVGHIMKIADAGMLQAPLLDPRWDRLTEALPQQAICEWCHEPFVPSRVGARFCSKQVPPCGAQYARSQVPHVGPRPRDPGITGLVPQGTLVE